MIIILIKSDLNLQLKQDENCVLITYRCQINTNGLALKVNSTEGEIGKIQAYITSSLEPKCCRVVSYDLRALSLHYRLHTFDEDRPFNTLSLKGTFSSGEIQMWLTMCIPEFPNKLQVFENKHLWFKSSLLGTVLHCYYQKGDAELKSDNITTISILKENLTRVATKKRNKIDIVTKINDESIDYVITSLEDKIKLFQEKAKTNRLSNAIEDLNINDGIARSIPTKYSKILGSNPNDGSQENLVTLYNAITNLYEDYIKLKGIDVNQKSSRLIPYFDPYDSKQIIAFFKQE